MLHIKKTSTDLLVHIISQKIHTHFRIENTNDCVVQVTLYTAFTQRFDRRRVKRQTEQVNRNFVLKSPKSTIKTGSHVQKKRHIVQVIDVIHKCNGEFFGMKQLYCA